MGLGVLAKLHKHPRALMEMEREEKSRSDRDKLTAEKK